MKIFFFSLHRCKDFLVGRCLQALNTWFSWRPSLRRSVLGELLTALQPDPASSLWSPAKETAVAAHSTPDPIPALSPPPPWCCHRGNVTSCKFSDLFSIAELCCDHSTPFKIHLWMCDWHHLWVFVPHSTFDYSKGPWIYQGVWHFKRSLVHCHEESMRRWLQAKPG